MKKVLARFLLFVLLVGSFSLFPQLPTHADSGLPNTQHGNTVSVLVPPNAADYQLAFDADNGSNLYQSQTDTFTITYGASESAGLATPLTIVAHYSNALAPDNSHVIDYIVGSASDGYGDTKPVVDLQNRTITWYIPSIPAGIVDQHVTFQITVNDSYRGKIPVWFTTTADMSNQYMAMPEKAIYQNYLFDPTKVKPGPTATPGPPDTPTPTIAPPVLKFSGIAIKEVSATDATITVSTTQAAQTFLLYGTSPKALTSRSKTSGFSRNEAIQLTGLTPKTTYYFEVVSVDRYGKAYYSEIFDFQTASVSPPPTLEQSIFVIASGPTILLSNSYQANQTSYPSVLLLPDMPLSVQLKLKNQSATKDIVLHITDNSGLPQAEIVLRETTPGVYSGSIMSPDQPGAYSLSVQLADTNGNIVDERLANMHISPPLRVLDSGTHQPITDARVTFSLFAAATKSYQAMPETFVPGLRNPGFTDEQGEYRILFPTGNYEVETTALGYKTTTVAFELGNERGQDFPTIYLERDLFNVPALFTFMKDWLQDLGDKLLQFNNVLIHSPRVFSVAASGATAGFVLLGYLLFTIRAQIRPEHLLPFILFSVAVARNKHKEAYLSGIIRDNDNDPLSGVQIDIIDPKAKTILSHTQTTAAGTFHIKNSFGNRAVLFLLTKEGFAPQEVAVDTTTKASLTYTLSTHGDTKPMIVEEFHHLAGSLFEVSLLFSLILELMFFITFGAVQSLPFLALSLVNIFLWLFYLEEHTRI